MYIDDFAVEMPHSNLSDLRRHPIAVLLLLSLSAFAVPIQSDQPQVLQSVPSNSSLRNEANISISDTQSSSSSTKANKLNVFNHSSDDVIELILNTNTNKGSQLVRDPSGSGRENHSKIGVRINLEEARDEIMRRLQSEAREEEDSLSHEIIRTISEDSLREALDEVIRQQLKNAQRKAAADSGFAVEENLGNQTTASSDSSMPTFTSQLISQFFIFGTLFGVVCSISTCTCCLQPRSDRSRSGDLDGVNPTNIPAPIDYSKPYMLKCDSRGSCYASPLGDDEVPPLPTYDDALACARQPVSASSHSRSKEVITV